jgi:pimeloyl-ACP methyl ester carboxylesterase
MDEASSRFVDRIAVDKLVQEKLAKVHHYPARPLPPPTAFAGTLDYGTHQLISYPAERPRGTVLFVHGLFEDQREIYGFLFSGLRRLGYSIALYSLPHHYERKSPDSQFGGELFFSADITRTRQAFLQAAAELGALFARLRQKSTGPVYLAGFSMGASIALLLSTLVEGLDGVCAINPPAVFPDLIWSSPLCRTIRADLETAGVTADMVATYFRDIDPHTIDRNLATPGRILMIQALYDLVTEQRQYEALANTWQFPHRMKYNAGHLNTLRVPRLADDMAKFFDALPACPRRNQWS